MSANDPRKQEPQQNPPNKQGQPYRDDQDKSRKPGQPGQHQEGGGGFNKPGQ